ncbi:MAG: hypothetical protein ACRCVW_00440 [Brevinema sp.]
MKNDFSHFRVICLIFLSFIIYPSLSFCIYEYPFYTAAYKLKEINTQHFRIIYSDKSTQKAYEIAAMAEKQFELLTEIYGPIQNIYMPIRVIVSADNQEANGFASVFLFPTVHLYVSAPPEISDSHSFTENEYLYSMLYHELTHIFTLSYRHKFKVGGFWQVFSDSIYPSVVFSSRSFIEGAAIARESEQTSGRLNDPYTYHLMRRDILDGKRYSFAEFSGANSLFGSGSYPYTYGGLFHNYLAKQYQKDFDREFWTAASKWKLTGPNIKKIANKKLSILYKDFFEDLSTNTPSYQEPYKLLLSKKERRLRSIQRINDYMYFYDYQQKIVYKYNLKTHKKSLVAYGNNQWDSVSVSPDEKLLFVSGRRILDKSAIILNIKATVMKSDAYLGIKQAFFLPTSTKSNLIFTAIELNNDYPELILYNGDQKKVLHTGNRYEYADAPISIDGTNIYFLHKYKDKTFISYYNIYTDSLTTINNQELQHIRFLTAAKDHISVSYASDKNSFYKRAIIKNNKLTLIKDNIKGEIFDSVIQDNKLIYRTSFSKHDNIVEVPLDLLSTQTLNLSTTVLTPIVPAPVPIPENISPHKSIKDFVRFSWLPLISPYRAGIRLFFMDSPAENILDIAVQFDFVKGTPEFAFVWRNQGLPININVILENSYVNQNTIFNIGEHHIVSTGIGLDFSGKSRILAGEYSLYTSLLLHNRFTGNSHDHPYQWHNLISQQLTHTLGISHKNIASEGSYGFYRLFEIGIELKKDYLDIKQFRSDIKIAFSPPAIPILFKVFGSFDSTKISTDGNSLLGLGLFPAFYEYRNLHIANKFAFLWIADLQLFSLEIQKGAGFGELYLDRWTFNTGYRGGYWTRDLHSIYFRTNVEFSLLYGNVPISVFFEVHYPFQTEKLGFNFGLNLKTTI